MKVQGKSGEMRFDETPKRIEDKIPDGDSHASKSGKDAKNFKKQK